MTCISAEIETGIEKTKWNTWLVPQTLQILARWKASSIWGVGLFKGAGSWAMEDPQGTQTTSISNHSNTSSGKKTLEEEIIFVS